MQFSWWRISDTSHILLKRIISWSYLSFWRKWRNGSIDVNISEDSDKVYLSVKDTGIGIAKEHLTKIFDRFYRVEESRTTNDQVESSTGLGLSIVQKICDLHNAKIQVESILGEGTEFKIIFNK